MDHDKQMRPNLGIKRHRMHAEPLVCFFYGKDANTQPKTLNLHSPKPNTKFP